MTINEEVTLTLEEAVAEAYALLTGLELTHQPELNRFALMTRQLNRALRAIALEKEWSYFADTANLGACGGGEFRMELPTTLRARIIGDDSVRLQRASDGHVFRWAYILPRDALHKYRYMKGLWCAVTRSTIEFSRPLTTGEGALDVIVPVMREPVMFRLPDLGEEVPDEILQQEVDFFYPDLVVRCAAFFYAQVDPIMQPRVQTLESQYKDLLYQIMERDDRVTDSPYMNEVIVPVENGLRGNPFSYDTHPHAQDRRP